jgi:polysaccharide export outer membrane protein
MPLTFRSIKYAGLWLGLGCCLWSAENPPAPVPKADYVLQPLDMLKIQIFQEEDLSRDVRISQEYTVTLPLIGLIDLRNKTIRQAQDLIQELYRRDYLVNPQINITVVDYAKRSINVLGSVGSPGVVYFPQEEGLNLLDAISRAGGFTRLADRKHVKLTRTTSEGSTETYIINADSIIQGTSSESWVILKDDIIYVPERLL